MAENIISNPDASPESDLKAKVDEMVDKYNRYYVPNDSTGVLLESGRARIYDNFLKYVGTLIFEKDIDPNLVKETLHDFDVRTNREPYWGSPSSEIPDTLQLFADDYNRTFTSPDLPDDKRNMARTEANDNALTQLIDNQRVLGRPWQFYQASAEDYLERTNQKPFVLEGAK